MAVTDTEIKIDEKIKVDISEPKKYNVIFLNDDKTPIEFVIDLLISVFKHTQETAKELTLSVHNSGRAVVGTYTFEIAEQKSIEATQLSRSNGFPLQIKVEVA